jgi:hypothetical protein
MGYTYDAMKSYGVALAAYKHTQVADMIMERPNLILLSLSDNIFVLLS